MIEETESQLGLYIGMNILFLFVLSIVGCGIFLLTYYQVYWFLLIAPVTLFYFVLFHMVKINMSIYKARMKQ